MSSETLDTGTDKRGEIRTAQVTLVRTTDAAGKPITFRTDPGFNHAPGTGLADMLKRKQDAAQETAMITVELNSARLQELLRRIEWSVGDLAPQMRGIAAELTSQTEENFEEQGRPEWKGLSDTTIERRTKTGSWPGQILQISAAGLAASITTHAYDSTALVGSNKPYAAMMHYTWAALSADGHRRRAATRSRGSDSGIGPRTPGTCHSRVRPSEALRPPSGGGLSSGSSDRRCICFINPNKGVHVASSRLYLPCTIKANGKVTSGKRQTVVILLIFGHLLSTLTVVDPPLSLSNSY